MPSPDVGIQASELLVPCLIVNTEQRRHTLADVNNIVAVTEEIDSWQSCVDGYLEKARDSHQSARCESCGWMLDTSI